MSDSFLEGFEWSESSYDGLDVINVIPLTGIKNTLSYRAPPPILEKIQLGSLVEVPILRRTEIAIVSEMQVKIDFSPKKLKSILKLVNDLPVLTEELLELARWIASYYQSSLESVFEAMIPSSIRKGMDVKKLKYLHLLKELNSQELKALGRKAPKQADLYLYLFKKRAPISRAQALKDLGFSPAPVEGLIQKALLKESFQQEERVAYNDGYSKVEKITPIERISLNEEQQKIADQNRVLLEKKKFAVNLVHGVTGAGKTEVYLDAMEKALDQGGGVLFLVPEVALAPQTVERVRLRFQDKGEKVVVWHSQLSHGERYDAWLAVSKGESRVVVGARSGVFAPVRDLRLIIVDEEHEPAYKQEENPRYNGRDVAVYRSMKAGAMCILGSATPSLESLYNVEIGKYNVGHLRKRVDDRKLPKVHIVDMKVELRRNNSMAVFSSMLIEMLLDRMDKKEQSILFLNRRGYSKSLICPECGYVGNCDHCSVTLTYHKKIEELRCHICGHCKPAPKKCPSCGSDKVRWNGTGTQKVEELIRKIIPQARVVRIDADTMGRKDLYREILNDFKLGKIDILIGTQMIAKGLDFPNVTLVGIINADLSLHVEDFRAGERTFQLMVQVAGRAGRGDSAGEVVVQTMTPFSEPLQFAKKQDFDEFFNSELAHRKEFDYPPYRHLIRHIFKSKSIEKLEFYTEEWRKRLDQVAPKGFEIRGPAPAPLERIKDEYRFHLWYFVKSVPRSLPIVQDLRENFPLDRSIVDLIDVDPMNMS